MGKKEGENKNWAVAVGGDDSEASQRTKSARRDTLHALEGGNERGGKKQKLAVAVFFF